MATKKQEIAEIAAPDPFLQKANQYAGWVEKHLRRILLVLGLAVATAIGAGVFVGQKLRTASALTGDLGAAVKDYSDVHEAIQTSTNAESIRGRIVNLTPKFDAIVGSSDKAGAALVATLYLADLHRRAGDHAKAEQLYRDFDARASQKDSLRFVALEGLGYACEEQGKLDDALRAFARMAEVPGEKFVDMSLWHQGRILEGKGDRDSARKTYERITSEFKDSKVKDLAEQRLMALE